MKFKIGDIIKFRREYSEYKGLELKVISKFENGNSKCVILKICDCLNKCGYEVGGSFTTNEMESELVNKTTLTYGKCLEILGEKARQKESFS